MALLAVEDLHVTFATEDGDVHAVRGVSFEVAAGETVGVVGESGSGKSVTAQAEVGMPGPQLPRRRQVFGLPGVGRLAVESVVRGDQPIIIGTVLLAPAFVVVANVLVDIGDAFLDPRVCDCDPDAAEVHRSLTWHPHVQSANERSLVSLGSG